jgi:hypothetical protein
MGIVTHTLQSVQQLLRSAVNQEFGVRIGLMDVASDTVLVLSQGPTEDEPTAPSFKPEPGSDTSERCLTVRLLRQYCTCRSTCCHCWITAPMHVIIRGLAHAARCISFPAMGTCADAVMPWLLYGLFGGRCWTPTSTADEVHGSCRNAPARGHYSAGPQIHLRHHPILAGAAAISLFMSFSK